MHIHTHPLLLDGAALLAHEARGLLLDDELGEPDGGAAGPHGADVPPQPVGHELARGTVHEEGVHLELCVLRRAEQHHLG